jgi:TRAP-type C4-dicarboxylate transport system substrate-binding protein
MVNRYATRVLAGVVVGVVVLGGCGAQADKSGGEQAPPPPLVLKGLGSPDNEESREFVDQVTLMSNGTMTVQLQGAWHQDSITGEAESIEVVRSGAADLALVPARAWHDAGVTSFDALIAPMVLDSYALQDAALHDGMVCEMLAGVGRLGLTGIGILPGPLRHPSGISRDLLLPSDFQGAKIAISPGAVADRSLRALGATPVPSAFNGADISSFDGLEIQIAAVEGNEYDGPVASISGGVQLWTRPTVIVGNATRIADLTEEQRQILTAAAKQAVTGSTQAQQSSDAGAASALCVRAELTFLDSSGDQAQQFRQAFAPVLDWLSEDAQTRKFLQRIQQLRAGVVALDEPIPHCAAQSSALSTTVAPVASTDLDGVYEMVTTVEESVARGLPIDGGTEANTGRYIWTFAGGKFLESQSNGPTQTWGDGTYVVDGDKLTMTYTNGGGSGPGSLSHMHGGFVSTWTWSLYHDQLTIAWTDPTVPPTEYPANYTVKPWTRIGDPPADPTPQSAPTTN